MYLHFLTATATGCAVKLMRGAILLPPEWMDSVFYRSRSVHRDLRKYTHAKMRVSYIGVQMAIQTLVLALLQTEFIQRENLTN